jgi:hypothetical protein
MAASPTISGFCLPRSFKLLKPPTCASGCLFVLPDESQWQTGSEKGSRLGANQWAQNHILAGDQNMRLTSDSRRMPIVDVSR